MARKCLVTGGAGFIGSHLCHGLLDRGDRVVVLDDFSTGRSENLAGLERRIELVRGDLNDAAAVARAVQGVEVVFHHAALASVPRSIDDPVGTNRANVDGTLALLVAARTAGARRVVYAASSSAYGDQPGFPRRETMSPQPLSPYAVSKLSGEYYVQVFGLCYGLETVCLRYFNVFGPRQDPNSQYAAAIPRFITRLLDGLPPVVYGDGEQSRDWTYVANVVHANLLAAEAPGATGRVINVACGQTVSVNGVIAAIQRVLGTRLATQHEPPRPGDVRMSDADIALAREALGYEALVNFEEGLRLTIAWFRERHRR
jgi:UDP-glucose 4-epimerase